MEETFTYDDMGRMTSREAVTAVNGTPQVTAVFSQPVFDDTKVHALTAATTVSGVFPSTPQAVTYTGFDKVSKVKQGNDSLCYTYGYDRQRIFVEEHVGNATRTKRYVGNCEYVTVSNGSITDTQWLTYLSGPTGVYAVVMSKGGSDQVFYVLKDNLGSWTAITDGNGTVQQWLSYDPWGRRRNPSDFGYNNVSHTFDRGYTLHEHYDDFDLINMNGRLYDPILGRMLSPDVVIQNEQSSQAYNRYSYCFNNPLRFTDPSGYVMTIPPEFEQYYMPQYLDDLDTYKQELEKMGLDNVPPYGTYDENGQIRIKQQPLK